jgi:hypothetical protein
MRNLRTLSIAAAAGALALGAVGIAGASVGSNHPSPTATAAHARNAARHQHGLALGHKIHDPESTTTTTAPDTTTTTAPATVPGPVHEAVGVVAPDGTSITLRWEAGEHGALSDVTGFVVQYSTDGGSTWTQAADSGMATEVSLPYAMGELFEVAAVNDVGTGAFTSFRIADSSDDDHGMGDEDDQSSSESGDQHEQGDADESSPSPAFSSHDGFGDHSMGGRHQG